jgi:hypothetical protein
VDAEALLQDQQVREDDADGQAAGARGSFRGVVASFSPLWQPAD